MTGALKSPGRTKLRWSSIVSALIMSGLLFWITYRIVFNFRDGDSDYIDHLTWAARMTSADIIASFHNGQERLWHVCVRLLIALGMDDTWAAAALVTAAADASACFLVCLCLDRTAPERLPRPLLAGLVLCVFLASSLTLPGRSFYTGRAAVNTWHNPTNIMVRPFAAAVFYMTVDIYSRRQAGEDRPGGLWARFRQPVFTRAQLVFYPLCVLFSAYSKPSFLQFFAPAILLFLLADVIRTRGALLPFCIKLALAYLPAALIVLAQFFHFFGGAVQVAGTAIGTAAASGGGKASGIAVYYIRQSFSDTAELLRVSFNHFSSVLYPCAFPLLVLVTAPRRSWRDPAFRLGWLCMAAALLEMTFLHETGSRASHGNFGWGYYLSVWLLWTAAMGVYVRRLGEKTAAGAAARWLGTPLLAWHTACGVAYIVRILQTAHYYF